MTHFKKKYTREGFTFVEFLIYFFILGIVLTAISSFMFDVIQTRTRVRLSAEVEQNMRLSMQRTLRSIRTAESLDVGGSTFSDPNGVLSLTMSDPSIDPTVLDLSNGILRITEGAGPAIALTTPDVFVEKYWVEIDNLPRGTKSITVQMEVHSFNPEGGPSFNYVSSTSSTAVIRRQR